MTGTGRHAVHRTILLVDVEGFGAPSRTLPHQLGTREGLYRVVVEALDVAGVPWEACHQEDRGDSVFVLVPPEYPKAPLVEVLPAALAQAARVHNDASHHAQRTRLRLAIHAGEVAFDDHGVTSTSLTTAFRLLDAAPVKKALADSPGLVAMVVSRLVYDDVVRHSAVLDPATFRPITVAVKEFSDLAWIALPDHPYPPAAPAAPSGLSGATPDRGPALPTTLPVDVDSFTGRAEELVELDRLCEKGGDKNTICAISGPGGIGKTTLAIHWMHHNHKHFPDGCVHLDLRGFRADTPLRPTVAIAALLRRLGVPGRNIPTDPDERLLRYQQELIGKRMLILLDNAVSTDQVRPLLPPGNANCVVLITSRDKLSGLVVTHGAHHLPVDVLTEHDARALLTTRLGAARIAAEPRAEADIVAFCAGLPLALTIVAGRAHTNPYALLATIAEELRDTGLDALDNSDPNANLKAVLSWSHTKLTTEQARLFELLGIAPGPDIGVAAAAGFADIPCAAVRKLLNELGQVSLVQQVAPDRFRMHGLVSLYAADKTHLSEQTRTAALRRILDFYIRTAHAADHQLDPHRPAVHLDEPRTDPVPDAATAMTWFDTEHLNLLAAQNIAGTQGWHRAVWALAWALDTYQRRRGHRRLRLAMWQAALEATAYVRDTTLRIVGQRHLGLALADLDRTDEAIRELNEALALAEHDRGLQAHIYRTRAWAWERQGDNQHALDDSRQALDIFRGLAQPMWEAQSLNDVGWSAAQLGDFDTARMCCQQALTLFHEHHNATGEAATLDSLGYIDNHTGHHLQAIGHYQRAIVVFRRVGIRTRLANSLVGLGHAYAGLDQHDHTRTVWREAIHLYQELGRDDEVARVQHRLGALPVSETGQAAMHEP